MNASSLSSYSHSPASDFSASPLVPIGDENDRDAIASWLCVNEGDHVLDVGAGSGGFALALAKLGARVTGIDRTRRYVDRAAAEAQRIGVEGRCTFVCSSLEVAHPLPIYDVLTSYLGLSELLKTKSLTSILHAMQRRVRTGGRVILIEQFPDDALTAQHRQGLNANASLGYTYVSLGGLLAAARDVGLTFKRSLRVSTKRSIVSDRSVGGSVEAVLRVIELHKAAPPIDFSFEHVVPHYMFHNKPSLKKAPLRTNIPKFPRPSELHAPLH